MRIQHLGHSALLVEEAGTRLLVDPGNFSDADAIGALAGLDAVLVTHQHPDHAEPALVAQVLEANPDAELHGEPGAVDALAEADATAALRDRFATLAPDQDIRIGGLAVRAVGGEHAVIHPDIPRVGNIGLVIGQAEARTGDGAEAAPRLGITGDSLEDIEDFHGIDALAFAVVAPWSKMRETIDFLRAVRPRLALPVHDAVASPQGRGIYLKQSTDLAPEGTEVRDWPQDRVVEL